MYYSRGKNKVWCVSVRPSVNLLKTYVLRQFSRYRANFSYASSYGRGIYVYYFFWLPSKKWLLFLPKRILVLKMYLLLGKCFDESGRMAYVRPKCGYTGYYLIWRLAKYWRFGRPPKLAVYFIFGRICFIFNFLVDLHLFNGFSENGVNPSKNGVNIWRQTLKKKKTYIKKLSSLHWAIL